jgi:hypothetical protein
MSSGELLAGIRRNLAAGLRLVLLRPVTRSQLSIGVEPLLALIALDLALTLLHNFVLVGADGYFNYVELPRALFYLPLSLLAGYLFARIDAHAELTLAVAIALLAAAIPFGAAGVLMELALRARAADTTPAWVADVPDALFWWWALAACCAIYRLGAHARARIAGALTVLALVVIPLAFMPRDLLWKELPDDEPAPASSAVTEEQNFYTQAQLLERDLSQLKPQRPGIADLYFVGAALYAEEDVFMREVRYIESQFRTRFDGQGRTLALINNPQTAASAPIASATSLQRALEYLGEVMDPEEDVLFLYLTTHGSSDHRLAVSFAPLKLNEINPDALARIIAASNIKWKVIVISACYSGGFIAPLEDKHTLVITAADAQHQSFGCGAESDFTYFGKAYFVEELSRGFSFIDAFDQARESIRRRELAEGFSPSNPQIYLGTAMRDKLARLEARLRAAQSTVAVR